MPHHHVHAQSLTSGIAGADAGQILNAEGPVHRSAAAILETLDMLSDEVTKLTVRLQHVLTPAVPDEAGRLDEIKPAVSPLTNTLDAAGEKASALQHQVRGLIDRLEV